MSEKGPPENAHDQSLLDDASTLLMFSKRTNSVGSTSDESKDDVKSEIRTHRMTPTSSLNQRDNGMNLHVNTLASPGPASVALVNDEDEEETLRSNNGKDRRDSGDKSKKNGSKKGMVAAAALAQAATVPLPLKRKAESNDSTLKPDSKGKINEHEISALTSGTEKAKTEKPETKTIVEAEKDKSESDRFASVPKSYIVDPDDGVITCICGFNDDDGFTIQCDHCFRWQHAICYRIEDERDAPDDFLCNICNPRVVDVKMAKRKQQERIRNIQNRKRRRVPNNGNKNGNTTSTSMEEVNRKESTSNSKETRNGSVPDLQDQRAELTEAVTSTDPLTNIVLINTKDAYPAVYLPLERNDYKDKYTERFVKDHSNDDWVLPCLKPVFTPIPIEIKSYSDASHSRVFPGYPKLGVYVKQNCHEGDYIEEFLGEVDFQRKYLEDPRNNYRVWGTAKPKVIFHPHWPIYIDARLSGNLTRYLRRSCNPNVELATIKVSNGKGEYEVKFVLRALRPINKGDEIHIKWDWDLRHPIWKLINQNENIDSIEEPKKYWLIHSVDTVLGSCDCACGNNNKDCYLLKVKRYSQSLFRSVKSKMNNRYKLNEILHGNKLEMKKQTPILCKLAHAAISDAARASEVLLKFNATKLKVLEEQDHQLDKKTPLLENATNIRGKKYRVSKTKKQTGSSPMKSIISSTEGPFSFNETKVKNPADLAIPISLTITEEKSFSTQDVATHPEEITVDRASSSQNNSIHHTNTLKHRASSQSSSPNTNPHSQMKKKLSFADYKKKIKPA